MRAIDIHDRARACAIGAAVGDALGMPIEFGSRIPETHLIREMGRGRLEPGAFTDDTEMALALAESLLAHCPLDPADLAARFVDWYRAGPPDVGIQTSYVLSAIGRGKPWRQASDDAQRARPDAAGNGSVMRCWPVALAHWDNFDRLLAESRLQSEVTHPHPDCTNGSAFINAVIYELLRGATPAAAVRCAVESASLSVPFRAVIEAAPQRTREELKNSGWVRHTIESAVWGLLTTDNFEEAVVQVANLGEDADTAAAVTGALAGAAYGTEAIPTRWRDVVHGEWPLRSGQRWDAGRLAALADELATSNLSSDAG